MKKRKSFQKLAIPINYVWMPEKRVRFMEVSQDCSKELKNNNKLKQKQKAKSTYPVDGVALSPP